MWDRVAGALDILRDKNSATSENLDTALADVRLRLEQRLKCRDLSDSDRFAVCQLLFRIHHDQSTRLGRRAGELADAVGGVGQALVGLLEATTSELVDQVPSRVCRNLLFGRAMISSVRSAIWLPRQLHTESDDSPENPAFQSYVSQARIPLSHAPLETEIVRSRESLMCESPEKDQRTFKELVSVSNSASYVAAPIVSHGRVIGILHADRPLDRTHVSDSDLTAVSALAECLSVAFERSLLVDRLRLSSARVEEMFGTITSQLSDIEATDGLDSTNLPFVPLGRHDTAASVPLRASSFLTPREREVLAQMATGATNAQIARALVISEETVKSHLKQISKKLGTSTRAAAVARFAQISNQLTEIQ